MISRGVILTVVSQVVMLISGFGINLALARLLGPEDYGTFGLVISILIIVEMFVFTGIPEAIRKFGGETPELMRSIKKKTLPWQVVYCLAMYIVLFFFTPIISSVLSDDRLTTLLRIAGLNVFFFGLHKYFDAIQCGLHNFFKYSLLGIIYSISRLVAIVGIVLAGFSLIGALIGNFSASVIGLLFGIIFLKYLKQQKNKKEINTKKYVNFIIPNIIYFVGLNLFFSIDLWFVKYFLSDLNVGYYVSAAALSKLPYFLSMGLSAVLLPSISHSIATSDFVRTREIISDSLRYVLIFLILIVVVVFFNCRQIIEFVMGAEYSEAGPVLGVLMAGLSLATIMIVNQTILISKNLMKLCFYQVLFLLIIDIILNAYLVPRYQMFGAAFSTSIVGLLGMIITSAYIFEDIKELLVPYTGKLVLAIIITGLFSFGFNFFALHIIFKLIFLSSIYFIVLYALKIINTVDIERLKMAVQIS
ncbi:oligosaccharide flippase family protein [candidate division KSB1 bacterium]|nr:oligosaccharide flippase family protein [candidate division KSB1 bacterium]